MVDILSIVIVQNNEGYYTAHIRFTDRFQDQDIAATSLYMIYSRCEGVVRKVCRGLYG